MAGSTSNGFRWDYDSIRPSLKTANQKAKAYLARVTTFHALRAEGFAKTSAPWTDRSSNARSGLTANAKSAGSVYQIDIFHTVPYGFWLEVRFAGKYAVIKPTVDHEAPLFFNTAKEILNKMFGAG